MSRSPVPPFPRCLVPLLKSKVELGLFLLTLFLLILLYNCTTLYEPPSHKPLSEQDVEAILSRIQEQDRRVSSFYTSGGGLTIKNWNWESESSIFIVGTKDPYRIKIEVTHPWGRPIVHILIDRTRLEVLSFPDKTLYLGAFTPEALSRFFPGDFDAPLIWAVLRGYPNLLSYHRPISVKSDQISLFNEKEEVVEVIDFYLESLLPKLVSFPERDIALAFSDFQENHGIYYARKVRVENAEGNRSLVIRNKKMVLNKTLPEQIFILEKPPSFGTSYLDEDFIKQRP